MSEPSAPTSSRDDWSPDELAALLNTLADGSLSEREQRRLGHLLQQSEAARQAFREFAALHAGLYYDYATLLTPSLPPPDELSDESAGLARLARSADPVDRWSLRAAGVDGQLGVGQPSAPATWQRPVRLSLAVLTAAAITVVAIASGLFQPDANRPVAERPPLAHVTRAHFLVPGDPARPLWVGQPLEPGLVALLSGGIELTLRNGVVITLEGPGEIDLQDELQAFLRAGNATVRMPKGMHGFRLATQAADVLDLGTEFSVMAGPDSVTDVQVFDGEVIATGKGMAGAGRFPQRLSAGEAMRFSPTGATTPTAIRWHPRRFVRRLAATVGTPDPGPLDQGDPQAVALDLQGFGRPNQRESLPVVRVQTPPQIDGRLDDWQEAISFFVARDEQQAAAEWVEGRLMYDEHYFYIAAHVGDPFPMRNACDPEVNPFFGWRGGGLQVRLSTDRTSGWPVTGNAPAYYAKRQESPTPAEIAAAANPRLNHLTMWYHAASGTACLTVSHGMDTDTLTVNPEGFRAAYQMDADGRGYVAEYAVPWRLLNCADDPPRSGDVLAVTWQTMWGDENGLLERDRLYECRNPIEPRRIFVWERAATWGRAEYR